MIVPRQCAGPDCDHPAHVGFLCRGHYNQRQMHPKRPLRPLVPRAAVARVPVALRVSPECAESVSEDRASAVQVLEKWHKKRK